MTSETGGYARQWKGTKDERRIFHGEVTSFDSFVSGPNRPRPGVDNKALNADTGKMKIVHATCRGGGCEGCIGTGTIWVDRPKKKDEKEGTGNAPTNNARVIDTSGKTAPKQGKESQPKTHTSQSARSLRGRGGVS